MRMLSTILLAGLLLGFGGCESSVSDRGVSIKAGGGADSGLSTLSDAQLDPHVVLMTGSWHRIEMPVAAFYENSIYPTASHSYAIDMHFGESTVTAYADCQKVTAHYRISDKEIAFSKASIAPAVDLATCEESEFADDAVMALFENSFTIEKVLPKEVVLHSEDFDTQVKLKR